MKILLFLALIPSLLCAQRAHFGSIHTGGSGSPGDLSTKADVTDLAYSSWLLNGNASHSGANSILNYGTSISEASFSSSGSRPTYNGDGTWTLPKGRWRAHTDLVGGAGYFRYWFARSAAPTVPLGAVGTYISVASAAQDANREAKAVIESDGSAVVGIVINDASETITGGSNFTHIYFQQLPSTESLLAGMVTPKNLDRVLIKLSSNFSNSSGNGNYQTIPFDVAEYNPKGNFDVAGNKYVVASNGDYHIDVVLSYQNNGTSSNDPMNIVVRKNGTSDVIALRHDISDQINSGGGLPVTLSGLLPGLVVGDEITIEMFDADDVIVTRADGSFLTIQQLPSSTVVMPDALGVEDVEELVFSNLLMTNGAAFDFGPYADVVALQAADFEKLRFQINARHSAGTIVSDSFTSELPLSEVTGDVRVILTEVAGAEANLKMTGTTGGTLTLSGVYNSTASVKIWAVKAQKTVINTTDTPVNDQSSSGYIDIGDTRIQWGNFENTTSAPVQTLPAPFSDQNYSITTTVHENAKLFSNAFSITSTSFRSAIWSDSGVATNGTVSWQAIGQKP